MEKPVLRWTIATLLIALFLFVLLWLPWQVQKTESEERQQQLIADTLWVEQTIRFQIDRNAENLKQLGSEIAEHKLAGARLQERISLTLQNSREIMSIALYDKNNQLLTSGGDSVTQQFDSAMQQADDIARLSGTATYTQMGLGGQHDHLKYVLPLFRNGQFDGSLVAQYSLTGVLDQMVPWWFAHDNEISVIDADDTALARRASGGNGRGVFTHRRPLDLPGTNLSILTNSVKGAPALLPNILVGSVIVLSLGLIGSLWALGRDVSRRVATEEALRQQVQFRRAMENSLITGLRARDLEGRITYVNPAFCQMVGFSESQLLGQLPPLPYWAPESMQEYQHRLNKILAGQATPQFETIFQRANGERFPVLVLESPLVDDEGRHTGWMGSILDITDRKRAEQLNRQQQEKLEAGARLATMGEMASILAHELNQPLAAISSYASGAINMLDRAERESNSHPEGQASSALPSTLAQSLRQALDKAQTQAQRAGHIIRSVHDFVRKQEPMREPVALHEVIEHAIPLIELQARPSSVRVVTQVEPELPKVLADRSLLEQVLLNLSRNAIEAMHDIALEKRSLEIYVRRDEQLREGDGAPRIRVSVIDHGHGISDDIAERLFSPFFSTKAEGMGMGLSICRTAIELHRGQLFHEPNPGGGTIFHFVLPAAEA